MPKIERTCQQCGRKFYVWKSRINAKFCSRECHYKNGHVEKICETCGKIFDVFKGHNERRFCSVECSAIAHTGENNAFFGKGYTRKGENHQFYGKHHSKETKRILKEKCSGENNSRYIANYIEFKCIGCGKIFLRRNTVRNKRQFCSGECKKKNYNHSEEIRKILSTLNSGKNNHGWLGGRDEAHKREAKKQKKARIMLEGIKAEQYLKSQILKGNLFLKQSDITPELVELKRAQLKLTREARNEKESSNA